MRENSCISVIVPVYCVEQYLEKCVSSIVNQTYKNLEIILVDDGSPDNCPQLCDDWQKKDKRIRVIHKENGGLSDARNAGLRASSGELVMFVDSDDWIAPEMAEKMEFAMRTYHADMVLCQFAKVFPDGREVKWFSAGKDAAVYGQRELLDKLVRDEEISNHVWRRLYKRKLIPDDIFPKGKNYEDIYVMVELSGICNTFVSLDAVYYYYRQNASGILQNKSYKNMLNYLEGLKKNYSDIQRNYPELKIEIDYAKARTTTYAWEDLHASKKMTEEEKKEIRSKIAQWGADLSSEALSKMFWRQRVYYNLIMKQKEFSASVWYELWFHENNLCCKVRRTAKKMLKRGSVNN